MAVDRLSKAAHDLLAAAVVALGSAAPTRRFVSHSEPAYDFCDQLVVHFDNLHSEVSNRSMPCIVVPYARFVVTYLHCIRGMDDAGTPPESQIQDDDASAILVDAWKMWMHFATLRASGTLVQGGTCGEVEFLPLTPVGPRGNIAGFRWPIDVQIAASGEPG